MVHVYYHSYSHHYEYDYLGLTVIYETVNLPVGWHLCSKVRLVYPSLRDAFVVRLVYIIARDVLRCMLRRDHAAAELQEEEYDNVKF